ncbi:unnamed protein product [Diamesa hyperborea]
MIQVITTEPLLEYPLILDQDENTIKKDLVQYFASMNNDSMSSANILVFYDDKVNASMEDNKSAAYGSWKAEDNKKTNEEVNKDEDEGENEDKCHYVCKQCYFYNGTDKCSCCKQSAKLIQNDVFTPTTTTTSITISSLYPTTNPPEVGSYAETKYLKIKFNPRSHTDVPSQLMPQNNNNNHLNSLQNEAYISDVNKFQNIEVQNIFDNKLRQDYKFNSLGLPSYDLHAINNEHIDSQTTTNKQTHNQLQRIISKRLHNHQLHQPHQLKRMKQYNNNPNEMKDDLIKDDDAVKSNEIINNPTQINQYRLKNQPTNEKAIEIHQKTLKHQNWPSLNEPYQRQASNIENHRHKKSSDKWNVNNVVDNLVQNSNLTTEVKMNFIHVLHANEQLNKALHEKKQSKMFIPHVFTAEWSSGIKKRRLKRNEMSEDVFQVDNETNGNNVENKNVNALMGNQKHKKGAKMIPIENDGKQQQQQNTVKDSVVSYSVYNLSESTPQHTTRIKLFQKQFQKWKILENEIIFSNNFNNYTAGNVIINSESRSNVDKTLNVEHIKLLLPQNRSSFNDSDVVDGSFIAIDQTTKQLREQFCPGQQKRSLNKRSIKSLQGFGHLPKDKTALRDCSNNKKQLCLALKDVKPPTFKLTIQFPYNHNEVFDKRSNNVKISNIFTDTSGDDSHLHVQFTLMSTSHYTNNYILMLDKCDLLTQLNVTHSIRLPPNKAIQVNMNFTLQNYSERKHRTCRAKLVFVENGATVVKREFFIKPRSRCLCLWLCSCLCFDSVLTTEAADLCHSLTAKNEYLAGLLDDIDINEKIESESCESDDIIDLWKLLYIIPLIILIAVFILGCIKGLLGCCWHRVGNWKFNYLEPNVRYQDAGRCHRFLINCVFFFLIPFVWCCRCFLPKEKDLDQSRTSIIGRSIIQEEVFTDSNESNGETDNDENSKLLAKSSLSFRSTTMDHHYRTTDTSETVFDIYNQNSQSKQHLSDDEDLRNDTNFVVNAMNQSHESLRKFDSHTSEDNFNNDPRFEQAALLVKQLLTARVVYRTINQKIGFVQLKDNQSYSIRGYFIPATNTGYQFITYNPIKQFWEISKTTTLVALIPHIYLDSKAFRRTYKNKIDVLQANDLSVYPKTTSPCINVQVQDSSMYNIN